MTLDDVIHDLMGTCATPTEEQRLLIEADTVSFDRELFCCDQCGWWCSTDELNNETSENLCDDCNMDP